MIVRIFLTGATGFIGSKVVTELINGGHEVVGLTRSDQGTRALRDAGAAVLRGDVGDLNCLRRGAADCDGVIHTAFDHDFDNFAANCEKDRRAILALGEGLHGSACPLVITSVTPMGTAAPGQLATEDYFNPEHPNPRKASELAGRELLASGANVSVVRLSQIHDAHKQGLVTDVIALAREKGVSAYVEDGRNCWSAAHVSDAARLYRLALENAEAGSCYHATAEEAILFREIAQAVGDRLGVPVTSLAVEKAADHFGAWLSRFAARDMSASSAQTRARLSWRPNGPSLLQSLGQIPQ